MLHRAPWDIILGSWKNDLLPKIAASGFYCDGFKDKLRQNSRHDKTNYEFYNLQLFTASSNLERKR